MCMPQAQVCSEGEGDPGGCCARERLRETCLWTAVRPSELQGLSCLGTHCLIALPAKVRSGDTGNRWWGWGSLSAPQGEVHCLMLACRGIHAWAVNGLTRWTKPLVEAKLAG